MRQDILYKNIQKADQYEVEKFLFLIKKLKEFGFLINFNDMGYFDMDMGKIVKNPMKYILLLLEYSDDDEEKESYKRLARFTTHGWNFTSEKMKKPKPWDVVFELKEVALSLDETKSKFEIVSVSSEDTLDTWKLENYKKWFESNYGGGWIKVDDKDLEWITTTSKSEIRDEKLKQLGI